MHHVDTLVIIEKNFIYHNKNDGWADVLKFSFISIAINTNVIFLSAYNTKSQSSLYLDSPPTVVLRSPCNSYVGEANIKSDPPPLLLLLSNGSRMIGFKVPEEKYVLTG